MHQEYVNIMKDCVRLEAKNSVLKYVLQFMDLCCITQSLL